MTEFLLDTNVISEMTRDDPNRNVVAFLDRTETMWVPSIVIHELEYGLRLLPQGQRRRRLYAMQSGILAAYQDRILPLNRDGAEWAARFRAQARRSGHTLDLGDALIAGTAKVRGLSLATRNVRDFRGLDIEVVNPWDPPEPQSLPVR